MPYRTTRQFYRAVFPRNAVADPKFRVACWRAADDPGFSVWVENWHASYRRAMAYPVFAMIWARGGEFATVQRGRIETRSKGDVFFVPLFEHLGILPIDDQRYRTVSIYLPPALMGRIKAHAADGESFEAALMRIQSVRDHGPATAHLVRELLTGGSAAAAAEPLYRYFSGLIELPEDQTEVLSDPPESRHPITQRIIDLVERNYPPRINLRQLEIELGYSRGHIISIFKSDMRTTPQQFLLIRKVGIAAGRLAAGETIHDIVYDLNFSDQSHLTRAFQACLGISPIRSANLIDHEKLARAASMTNSILSARP